MVDYGVWARQLGQTIVFHTLARGPQSPFMLFACIPPTLVFFLPSLNIDLLQKSHHLQIAEKINGGDEMVERTRAPVIRPPATPFSKAEFGESLTGNEQNDAGSDIVESSSFHHVALLKGKHVEDSKKPSVSRYPGKEEVKHSENDDIVVTDYQPPHRKAPIHNK
ncbi:unnamed protein product [Lactuca virosa]|uniref:Uncharacterized protein n=1 Tax=Lactuca virosa TaxID=75947 RepID=A0AAU9NM13_9ASTR|nr:unnamed protein product [Lactuca virosa]